MAGGISSALAALIAARPSCQQFRLFGHDSASRRRDMGCISDIHDLVQFALARPIKMAMCVADGFRSKACSQIGQVMRMNRASFAVALSIGFLVQCESSSLAANEKLYLLEAAASQQWCVYRNEG